MAKAYFVTGTDTSVGKTTVTCALLAAAKAKGLITLALKPVASGCDETPDGLRNSDALALQKAMTVPLSYAEVNPVALVAPMSPHLAAKAAGRRLTLMQISGFCRGAMLHKADLYLIEGAGGWRVPISDRELLSGLPKQLGLPVILVVGVRLGCINHATLTAEAILKDGVRLAGWVANIIEPDLLDVEGNLQTLMAMMPAPCLGVLPWAPGATTEQHAGHLDLAVLFPE